jgi:hypothetical protein
MMPDVSIVDKFSKRRPVLRNATQSELVKTVRLYNLLVSLYLSVSWTFCIKFFQSIFDTNESSELPTSILSTIVSSGPLSIAFALLEFCTLSDKLDTIDRVSAGLPSMASLLDCRILSNVVDRCTRIHQLDRPVGLTWIGCAVRDVLQGKDLSQIALNPLVLTSILLTRGATKPVDSTPWCTLKNVRTMYWSENMFCIENAAISFLILMKRT